jgi:peptide/nickel transport system permease protein
MRCCDIFEAIPNLLLAIIISSALGTGFVNTIIALGIGHVASTCRMIRAQFLPLRELEFVEAELSINCSKPRLIFKHMLPNAISPVIVQTTMGIGGCITTAAGLSYLGLGVQPPTPEWGAMLTAAKGYIRYYPHMLLFPGLCIAIVVLALNLFGDGLRDALDPKLKN